MEQKLPLAQNDPAARAALDAAIRARGGELKVIIRMCLCGVQGVGGVLCRRVWLCGMTIHPAPLLCFALHCTSRAPTHSINTQTKRTHDNPSPFTMYNRGR